MATSFLTRCCTSQQVDAVPAVGALLRPLYPIRGDWRTRRGRLSAGAKHLLADLRSFKPTYLLGVPRVFEKVYNAASQKAGAGIRGRVFAKRSIISCNGPRTSRTGDIIRWWPEPSIPSSCPSSQVHSFRAWSELKYLACGGAPLNVDLAHFFNGMDGITFIQGYGMTETAAPMIVNWQNANRVGSVGKPGPGMGVRTDDDGELQVMGPMFSWLLQES